MNEGSRKAIIAAFFANLGIAISKFVGFLLTGSAGLAAESVHSFADSGNQGLLLLGAKRSLKAPDEEHPFGHERERYFWAFIVALVLFSMGGLFALYEGIHKFRDPHETDNMGIAVGILIVAILLESYSLRTAVKETAHVKPPHQSYWQFIRTAKQPELPTVLLEDVAAETGLFLALAGVLLAHYTHEPRWDAVGSIAIGVLLVVVAFILAVEMKGMLMGETALPETRIALAKALREQQHIQQVVYLHTEHLGPDALLIVAKAVFDPHLSAGDVSRSIDEAEAAMRAAVPSARFIFIEPDIARSEV
ncbi:MAG: cation diffusion facilitator family transporter [Ilumatobacteraceae bacterium]|nr:cation diffusion facilitator family transporter [Ilumatobacteraceae bacterium]